MLVIDLQRATKSTATREMSLGTKLRKLLTSSATLVEEKFYESSALRQTINLVQFDQPSLQFQDLKVS